MSFLLLFPYQYLKELFILFITNPLQNYKTKICRYHSFALAFFPSFGSAKLEKLFSNSKYFLKNIFSAQLLSSSLPVVWECKIPTFYSPFQIVFEKISNFLCKILFYNYLTIKLFYIIRLYSSRKPIYQA